MFSKRILTLFMAAMVSTTMLYAQDEEPEVQRAVVEDGKLFIVDENGEKQEVDTSGARSISIQQSSKVVDQDGDRSKASAGKAILIGPDGEKSVFEFDGAGVQMPGFEIRIGGIGDAGEIRRVMPFPRRPEIIMPEIRGMGVRGMDGGFPAGPRGWRVERAETGKFMIGLHCNPSSPALRSHLELDGIGLTVQSISPSSPADDAELQQHDILLFANDQQLATLADLTKAVELAGEESTPIALTFLRAGAEKTAELSPKERPANEVRGLRAEFPGGFEAAMPGFEFRDLGPGIILEPDAKFDEAFKDIRKQMEEMQTQMRAEMKQMMEQQNQMIERDR